MLRTNKVLREMSALREHTEGIEYNGMLVPVLYRDSPQDETNTCPFCSGKHEHGTRDGHRAAHCNLTDANYIFGKSVVFKNKDGQIFDSKNGYYVKSIMN